VGKIFLTAVVGMGQIWIWWQVFRTVHRCQSMATTNKTYLYQRE